MTCEDILISQVPAARAEGFSAQGNFVFLGGRERKFDTHASSGLCRCAKCILCSKCSTRGSFRGLLVGCPAPVVLRSLFQPLPLPGTVSSL